MRILWVATKPPLPSTDGGRLVARTTIAALAAAGHEPTIVAPVAPAARAAAARAATDAGLAVDLVEAAPQAWSVAALRALRDRTPVTIARHAHAALRRRVGELLATERFDVVHAEQIHALAACTAARARDVPVVLRAQNVESDLWRTSGGLRALEGRRLARFEGAAVRGVDATIALTMHDAERLTALAGGTAHVQRIAAPLDAVGRSAGPPLPGAPALVLPASAGWTPNDEATAWFVRALWPEVRRRLPDARLHRFGEARHGGPRGDGVAFHPAPADSATLFPANALVVIPLRHAVGVRMRILEGWARGVPIVATPAAAAGLDRGTEDALALGATPDALVDAIVRLAGDAGERARLVAAGRAALRAHHDPAAIAVRLGRVYAEAVRRAAARV